MDALKFSSNLSKKMRLKVNLKQLNLNSRKYKRKVKLKCLDFAIFAIKMLHQKFQCQILFMNTQPQDFSNNSFIMEINFKIPQEINLLVVNIDL